MIADRLLKARASDRAKYIENEKSKRGNLRIGSSGIMSIDGDIAGQCHRQAHLRHLGIELDPPDQSRLLMFEGGFANEDRIYLDLQKTLLPGEVLLREDECPIEYYTSNGTRVSGRPDILICHGALLIPATANVLDISPATGTVIQYTGQPPTTPPKPIPVLGIELKSINSVWVSRDCFFGGSPKMENLVQAAHYAWKLGNNPPSTASGEVGGVKALPYRLIYRQYNQQVMPKFGLNLPQQGEPMSEHVEYNNKGEPKFIRPFEVVYALEIDPEGQVWYEIEGRPQTRTRTLINTADIERYMEYVSKMAELKTLGPEFLLISATGLEGKYDHAAYCSACRIANEVDNQYDLWLDECKKQSSNGSK